MISRRRSRASSFCRFPRSQAQWGLLLFGLAMPMILYSEWNLMLLPSDDVSQQNLPTTSTKIIINSKEEFTKKTTTTKKKNTSHHKDGTNRRQDKLILKDAHSESNKKKEKNINASDVRKSTREKASTNNSQPPPIVLVASKPLQQAMTTMTISATAESHIPKKGGMSTPTSIETLNNTKTTKQPTLKSQSHHQHSTNTTATETSTTATAAALIASRDSSGENDLKPVVFKAAATITATSSSSTSWKARRHPSLDLVDPEILSKFQQPNDNASAHSPPLQNQNANSTPTTGNTTTTTTSDVMGGVYTWDPAELHRMYIHFEYVTSQHYILPRQFPFDDNKKNRHVDTSATCQRTCPNGRNNHIVYKSKQQNGLLDRMHLLEVLLNLSGYLCATLHVPNPKGLLGQRHNNDIPLSNDATWSDYRTYYWLANMTEPTFYEMNTQQQLNGQDWNVQDYGQENGFFQLPAYKDLAKQSGNLSDNSTTKSKLPRPSVFVHTQKRKKTTGDFFYINGLVQKQLQGHNNNNNKKKKKNKTALHEEDFFVWYISSEFWFWDFLYYGQWWPPGRDWFQTAPTSYPDGLPFWRRGCKYTAMALNPHIMELADKIGSSIPQPRRQERRSEDDKLTATTPQPAPRNDTIVGVLHIRRGDMIEDCDTSLEKMKQYLACSLNGTAALGKNLTILIQTDETDPVYLDTISSYLTTDNPHVQVEYLEPIAHQAMADYIRDQKLDKDRYQTNFLVFAAIGVFRYHHVSFFLNQRRYFWCNDCDPILPQLH